MERTYVKTLQGELNQEVLLKGWVHRIHDLGRITFVMLRDKTGLVQLVLEESQKEGLRLEAAVEVKGICQANEKAPRGLEVAVASITIVGKPDYEVLPIAVNREEAVHLETKLDHRTISLRQPKTRAPFVVQQAIVEAFRQYLTANHFSEIHTPKILSAGTEGGSEMFTVKYFDTRAFLAQSPQFYKQMMVGAGFERVFEIGHAYRAELHNTWRHLNEYVSLDLEMGFIESEEDIMAMEEGFMRFLMPYLQEHCQAELELLGVTLPAVKTIPRLPLAEAQEILQAKYGKASPPGNLDAEGEKLLSAYIRETYDTDFVFITRYPTAKRPVYTMPFEDDPTVTRSFDLLLNGLEITTGGQRIHDYQHLVSNMKAFDLNPDDFAFYTESFRYGMPPHGGLAIGLERLTMKLCGLTNIREATLLPRDMKRLTP
ncbi:aspartate--tRNA(Asn) ligase [Anoxynatronum sibiricum]|uniref:Aspartate--tRNA(Asp/Asn) ligase n=1 Tax=Anoxynatronum sibiricum TaxID=210623 RepID=A0ABU9VUU5_9CLOT